MRNHDKPEPPPENTCVYCDRVYASEAVLRSHLIKVGNRNSSGISVNWEDVSSLDKPDRQVGANLNSIRFNQWTHVFLIYGKARVFTIELARSCIPVEAYTDLRTLFTLSTFFALRLDF